MTRYGKLALLAVTAIGAAGLAAGCGSSRSILYKGIGAPMGGRRTVITDARATQDAKHQRSQWLADIARRGRTYPRQRFANLPEGRYRQRLEAIAARYHLTLKSVHFFHPRGLAPFIVFETSHYLACAHAIGKFMTLIDPHKGPSVRSFAFEALFLEAQDERGVPFIIVSNVLRGPNPYGGQWARSNELLPGPVA